MQMKMQRVDGGKEKDRETYKENRREHEMNGGRGLQTHLNRKCSGIVLSALPPSFKARCVHYSLGLFAGLLQVRFLVC